VKKTIFLGFILAFTICSCNNNSSNTSSGKKSVQDVAETQNRKHKTGYKYVENAEQVIVYYEKDRFGGWPANNGAWIFSGDELLVGFIEGPYELKQHNHNIGEPSSHWLARSKDGGETWSAYDPDNFVGDFGDVPEFKIIEESIDFEASRFVMRVGGTYGGADPRGYFFYSYDAGMSWKGPYGFGDLINHPEMKKYGLEEITPRTDYVVTGKNECIVMMSAREKGEFGTDRLFSIKTEDGGKTFQFLGWVIKPYSEDEIDETLKVLLYDDPGKNPYATQCRAVMSQTSMLPGGKLVTVMRRKYTAPDGDAINSENWVDAYASVDGGKTWTFQSMAGNGGKGNGNPPALAITANGRLCTVFGEREFGTIQVAYSSDEGKSWSEPQILFDEFWSEDMEYSDMGYPRVLARSDGQMVAVFYYSTKEKLHYIHATIWDPSNQ